MVGGAQQTIHPTAVIEAGAKLGEGVSIGPFCVVGPEVTLADGVTLHSHVVVTGRTSIGARTKVFPFASLGHQPQDLKYAGEPSDLTIGSDCLIREGVTMNPGTSGGGMHTVVGDRCAFLANSHVGHDCRLGNNIILSNGVLLAGHVSVGDGVIAACRTCASGCGESSDTIRARFARRERREDDVARDAGRQRCQSSRFDATRCFGCGV